MKPQIFAFFSGAGFLDLGFEDAGFELVFANELVASFRRGHQFARTSMNLPEPRFGYSGESITSFLDSPLLSDQLRNLVTQAKATTEFVGFIGGPPCPDFSVGGKNKGRDGEHGQLSGTYVELICQHSPDFFLFENVKGLWRTKRHKAFFDELKTKLRSHGYVLTEKLVNTLRFGVPQERERIILIGVKANPERQDVLNSMISDFPWWRYAPYSASDLERIQWPETDPFITGPRAMPPKIQQRLTVEHWFNKNDVVNHPNAQHRFQPRAGLARFLTVEEGDDSKKSYKRLHRWRYSPTACYGNNEVHLHPYEARRISVAEALAIQSLPRAYCLPPTMTLSDMFKTVGNGVPYVAAKALASALRDFLEEFHGKTNGVGSGSVHRGASKRQTLQLPEPRKPRDDIYSVDQGA